MNSMIIGIDPGLTGAIAYLTLDNLIIEDMPLIQHNRRREIDSSTLYQSLLEVRDHQPLVVIEDVHAGPNDYPANAFTFGRGFGRVLAAIEINKYKLLRIKPGAWKPALNLSNDKRKSVNKARRLFPLHAKKYFNNLKHHDRAEAALLAYYVRKCFREGAG